MRFINSFTQLRLNGYVIEARVLWLCLDWKAVNLHCPPSFLECPCLECELSRDEDESSF